MSILGYTENDENVEEITNENLERDSWPSK